MGSAVDVAQVFGNQGVWGQGGKKFEQVGASKRAGDLGRPHLGSHQSGATGHIQDQGGLGWAWKGLGEAVHCKAGGTVLQGSHILGTER